MIKQLSSLLSFLVVLAFVDSVCSAEYDNFNQMRFVDIPAGSFHMGSCSQTVSDKNPINCSDQLLDDSNAFSDEIPRHKVAITKHFQIGVYEVLVSQFMSFVTQNPEDQLNKNTDFLFFNKGGENLPVTYVSWTDVQRFLAWLNTEKPADDAGVYRLPTEAEWEYASRSGKDNIYFFGNSPDSLILYSWYDRNSVSKGGPALHATGSKQANPWGVFDMYGNVWEWVSDWYDNEYYGTSPKDDPDGPASGQIRVIRGGAANFDRSYCRSAARESYPPRARSRFIGFRVVREIIH